MNKNYTLDQITDGQYVFLERPEEINRIIIPESKVNLKLSEGDIVEISHNNNEYKIKRLEKKTEITREKVNDLLEKLKNKNKQ